jgi:phage recombination protein Bet
MSTELTTVNNSIAARLDDADMVRTLRETVCKGATEAQFRMFAEICKSTGLNPFLKEIWFVPGVGVMAGRDGYLRVANEHPQFDGMETLIERGPDNKPLKATCRVYRKDRSHPITCEAYYNEYRKGSSVWQTYPSAMIGKVAEVMALKRSFSINGVVSEEEIGEQEPRGSREAQEDVAAAKIAELEARKAALVVHEAVPAEPAPPVLGGPESETPAAPSKRKPKAPTPFNVLEAFAEQKSNMCAEMGKEQGEAEYYRILGVHGYEKSNQIPNVDTARPIFREMAQCLKDFKAQQPMPGAER